jgi:glutamate-1-semialdehyde 2,1-aminomutase
VMTGFRLARGGAQQLFNIQPDLTTLGKIIGAGLPIAAYGGRSDVMSKIAPSGPVYQAGTLSGNPLAVTAGIAMLRHIEEHPEIYDTLEKSTAAVTRELPAGACVNRVGSMATFFFQSGPVRNYEDAKRSATPVFSRFFHHLLERGIYFPPSQFESFFVSTAHTPEDIEYTRRAIADFRPSV